MRPVTLGRKNWLHVGSAKAGPKVAALFSIVESCRRLGVPVKDYMLDVLPGMDRRKLSEMAQLTPSRWSASHIRMEAKRKALESIKTGPAKVKPTAETEAQETQSSESG